MIDRPVPTPLPVGTPLLRQGWRHLLFLHWDLPAEVVRPLVPAGLELDLFEDRAWVGLVPFTMCGTRARFAPPLPGMVDFHEVNVRTYVHHRGQDPGVWFFSLDATSRLAVAAARALYHLPYHRCRIRFDVEAGDPPRREFAAARCAPGPAPPGCRLSWSPHGPERQAAPSSREFFLLERYVLYAGGADGGLHRGRVHHPAYPIQDASVESLEESLLAAAGIPRPDRPPLVHSSPGVDVEIYAAERLG